ncbi:MAG: hypothetical protein WD468_12125 [Pirellulales bacterium]
MAGKKRFAAKLVVWISVLATGGAGAYYVTSGGGWSQLFGKGADGATAKLVADDAGQLSSKELDAVASSWASADESRSSDDAISPSARSAEVTLAGADMPAASVTGSRYAIPSVTSTSVPVAIAATEPTVDDQLTAADSGPQPEEAVLEPTPALARGQEPSGDDKAADDIAELSDETGGAALAAEPRELESTASATDKSVGALRARDAFRDEPATKAAAGATAPSRYASAPSANFAAAPNHDAKSDTAIVNPFASAPATLSASAGAAGSPDSIQALPAAGDGFQSIPAAGAREPLPAEAARSARATYSQPQNGFGNSGQSPPLENAPFSSNGLGSGSPGSNAGSAATIEGTGKPGERALEGPQKPALVIQKIAPAELQVGKPAKFIVQVRNVGGQAAENVTIRDEVPQGTKLVSTTPTAESEGSQLVWRLDKLSAGEERIIEMQVMPTSEGEIGSVATVTYSAQASVKARCTMPQLALRLTAPNQVMIGGEQRVKIELRNPGTGDATGVMLFENVPEKVKHAAGPTLEFEIGTLRAGETRELELLLKAEKAGKVVNVLSARAEGNLQVQQQVEFEVIAPALSVEVNGPERRYLERPATYEVIVANPGTAVAHDVHLVTKLPKGMRFVRANNMGEYDAATHAVYWSLAELPEGERGSVELVAMPIETGPQTLEVEGHAQQGLSDQKQQQIIVEGLEAIMFEVRDLEDPIEVGGETGYEIRVVNQGTKAATNVKVSVNLPPGMQVISAEGETRHAAQGTNIVFEPLAQLAPKADTVYRVKVQGMQAGDQRVIVEVNTDDLGQPIRREESTRVFGDE